jgi:hypothetical protein
MSEKLSQIVYVLTNPVMPGIVKIGKTTQLEVSERMKQLYSTGVPVPFECAFACQVKDATEVEKALHTAFGMTRINPNREFFKLDPANVIAVLKLLRVDDITQEFERNIESDVPTIDKESGAAFKRTMRPHMNFYELDIPQGSVLVYKDGTTQCIVVAEKRVSFNGEEMSLTAATRKVMGLPSDYPLQPSPHWSFNSKTVKQLYEDFHGDGSEE